MTVKYVPKGVCSRLITIEINDGIIESVQFTGGCNGNANGLAALAKGMRIEDVIERLEGIKCGSKQTSCPDQLARALKELL